jgi:structural maintenance of chromosome 1
MGKLIRLELFNFKSYKGHHVLLFGDSYFTSIIGPNGSGKSNSMDAISFVLGIKSSHLRSSHLRDLVYRGRVLKTSVIQNDGSATTNGVNGHVNGDGEDSTQASTQGERNDPKSAWVMAVYEDDAGDEQAWKRTITNQGASEYRINNRVVTAQQYNEALEAENILIKARNFLVFQGDVEAIASQSPKDLTRLIEQISGSLEYKADYERLKEAQEEALENQNFNLHRRRGINSEIKQYQEQKREADSYQKKVDQVDQAIVTQILYKLYHFQKSIEEAGAEIQKHQQELKEHRRGIAKYEQNLDDARKEQAKVGKVVGTLERIMKTKERETEEKETSLVPITEKIHLTRDHLTKTTARVAGIAKERDAKAETIKRYTKDLKSVEKAEAQWESEFQKLNQQAGRALSQADMQQYNTLKEEVSKRSSENQIQAQNLSRQLRADEDSVSSLKNQSDTISQRLATLQEDTARINENKINTNQAIKDISKEIQDVKKDYHGLTSERLRAAQIRTELDEKLHGVLTKLLEAEDGRKQSEKETKLKATIADMKRIFPGVRGRVGELCRPKQKRYGEAVSTVLGRHFDAVIVDDDKTARDCIEFLREQRRGQATFIPLDTIQVKPINSNLKNLHAGSRMAIDVIDYDKSLDRAMSYACGNSIVCDDLKIARHLCYEKGVEAKAVTLDGTVIHKGGLITGGRGREQTARRWEDSEVDNLRKLAEKIRSELAALPEARKNATEEERLQATLVGLEQKLAFNREESKAHERNLTSTQMEILHAKKELAQVKPELEKKQRELQTLKTKLKSFSDAVEEVEDEIFETFCQRVGYENIRQYEAQQGSLQQEGAQKRLEFTRHKSQLESKIIFEQRQLEEINNRIKALEDRIKQDRALIRELETQKEDISNESDALAARLEELKEKLEEEQERHEKKAEKVAEQRRELQKRSKNIDGTMRAISNLEADIQRKAGDRYGLLRKCKLEDITIPLASNSKSLDTLPINAIGQDNDAMDVDEDPDSTQLQTLEVQDYGIEIDFDDLEDDLKEVCTHGRKHIKPTH